MSAAACPAPVPIPKARLGPAAANGTAGSHQAGAPGYICLHRKLLNNPIFTHKPAAWFKLWIFILLKVNWKSSVYRPRTGDPIEIPAGSMVTSLDKLAHAGEHTKEQARKCLRYLKTARMIEVEGTHHWTKITVLNWTTYQQVDQRSEHSDRHERGGSESEDEPVGGTHERTHAGTLSKEIKKNSTTSSKSGDLDLLPGIEPNRSAPRSRKEIDPEIRRWFESEFWPAYPRHEAKVKSLLAANEKATTPKKRAFYLDRLKGQLPEYLRRKAESGQRVIPLGATWFKQDRAEDELPLDAAGTPKSRCMTQAMVPGPEYQSAEDYLRRMENE